MNNNVLSLLDGVNQEEINSFVASTKSSLNLKKITSKKIVDYSWVNVICDYIPYLDNIINNHRNFYINENKENDLINKLLNTQTEQNKDVYEDRFVFTLINRLSTFISDNIKDNSEEKIKNEAIYDASSKYNDKNVKINLSLETIESNSIKNVNEYKEKIDYINTTLNNYKKSSFMKSLNDVMEVKSPIRKTNTILRDKNYRKALELWEYLDNYETSEPDVVNTDTKESKNVILNKKFTLIYYLNLLALDNIDLEDKKESEEFLKLYLSKLIYDYVEDTNITEKQFKAFINREFKEAKKNKVKKENNIYECFRTFQNKHNNNLKDAFINIQSDFKVDKENYML